MIDTGFVPTAEAAFIAGLSDKQMQRVFDEHILHVPIVQNDNGRLFTRLAAVLARFYFEFDDTLTAKARRYAIAELSKRVLARSDANAILALNFSPLVMNWAVKFQNFDVELLQFVEEAQARAAQIGYANRAIIEDPEIMGGVPVFHGTRVPVETVAATHRAGASLEMLRHDYPFLTADLIEAAEIYQAVHPRRGRPANANSALSDWKVRDRKVIRPGTRPA